MLKIVKLFLSWRLEAAVFIAGAVVMIFEIVGSRLLAPYLGTSLITWTSIIGVILASLAAGYYWGGKLADKKADSRWLALILTVAGCWLLITLALQGVFLGWLATAVWSLKIKAVLASVALLAPVSVFLGMVSPYAAKLKLSALAQTGSTVGSLYALSTIGSLVGTFGAGFWLVPLMGTTKILVLLAALLWLAAAKLFFERLPRSNQLWAIICGLLILGSAYAALTPPPANVIDRDTAYSRVWIYDALDKKNNQPVRIMSLDGGFSSAMFLESNDLVFDYTKYYQLAGYFNPALNNALMLGGAAYSYPKAFLQQFPRAALTVVEIDPAVTALAKKYFKLPADPRLLIQHQDGRVWLNQTADKYDAVLVDAFSSFYGIPFQLTTKEAAAKEFGTLTNDGVVVVNVISALTGSKGQMARSLYYTYKQIFPQVYLFPVNAPQDGSVVQNIMLVALKSKVKPNFISSDQQLQGYLDHLWTKPIPAAPILTDDWAPTDYFISQIL
jgi:spermidine synthase